MKKPSSCFVYNRLNVEFLEKKLLESYLVWLDKYSLKKVPEIPQANWQIAQDKINKNFLRLIAELPSSDKKEAFECF